MSGDEQTPERTIDQLAHEVGLPVSTLRMYQHRGLLPPPVKRGRVGWYDEDHLARLRMVAELQERGFSLAAIKELLDGWEHGRSIDQLLGLDTGESVWRPEEPLDLTPLELAARFPTDEVLDPKLVARALELGLIELLDDGRMRVHSPRFLEIGSGLMSIGVPPAEVMDEYEALREITDGVADRFTDLFRRHVWPDLDVTGMDPAAVARVRAALDQLGPMAVAVVDGALRQSLQAGAQAFLDEQAEALAAPKAKRAGKKAAKARAGKASAGTAAAKRAAAR